MNNFDFFLFTQISIYVFLWIDFIINITQDQITIKNFKYKLLWFSFVLLLFGIHYYSAKTDFVLADLPKDLVLLVVLGTYLFYSFGSIYLLLSKQIVGFNPVIIKFNLITIVIVCVFQIIFVKLNYNSWYGLWFIGGPIVLLLLIIIIILLVLNSNTSEDPYEKYQEEAESG